MDIQLKELLEKINKEGVETAEKKALEIISEAERKAEDIVSRANKEAQKIIESAKIDAKKAEEGGRSAIAQAGRDLVLKTKKEIEALLNRIIEEDTKTVMTSKVLEDAIISVVKDWSGKGEYNVQLSEKDYKELEKGLFSKLSKELKTGIEIKPFANVESGFRVSEKDGSSYYNFTAEAIALNLAELLNQKLSAIITENTEE